MGEPSVSKEHAPGRDARPDDGARPRAWRIFATLPLVVACAIAAATMNAALAPAHDPGEQLRQIRQAPPPPSEIQPAHHDEAVFDPSELISV